MSDFTDFLDRIEEQERRVGSVWTHPILFVIDPAGCACTDCTVGNSIPKDLITDQQQSDIDAVRDMNPLAVLDRW